MKGMKSKTLATILAVSAVLLSLGGLVQATPYSQETRIGAPAIVSYQGNIYDDGTPYDGTGYFMFAVVDAGAVVTFWSNNGNVPPTTAVPLTVSNGLFSINLGDTDISGMSETLSADVFDEPETYLRVWFSPDGLEPWVQLPDQQIAAVPYAFQSDKAALAEDSLRLDGLAGKNYQLVLSTICPDNYAFSEIGPSGVGVCIPVEHRPAYSLTIVPDKAIIGADSSIAIGVDGLPLISFYQGTDGTHGSLGAMHCKTLDCTDYDLFTIDDSSSTYVGTMSSLIIGRDGLGLIAYADGLNNELTVAHCADLECSEADIIRTIYTGGGVYSLLSLSAALGVDGNPLISLIAWQPLGDDLLYVIHCNDLLCSSATTTQVYSSKDLQGQVSLTIGVDGFGSVAYHDNITGELRVAHCTNINCTAFTTQAIDGSGDSGVDNAYTIGVDGLGLIAYYSETLGGLKVAHCTNIACNAATLYTLDDVPGEMAGMHPAITIGSDGLGLITYDAFISASQYLRVAHCSNINCSSVVIYAIDALLDSEYSATPSLTIGTDGLPIIAYYDGALTDLKVMHCSNELCLPYVRRR